MGDPSPEVSTEELTAATLEEVRADAAALDRAADVLADASLLSGMGAGETPKMLRWLAAGMRHAVDRMSGQLPF